MVGTGVGVEVPVGEGVEEGVEEVGVGYEEVGAAAAKNGMSERMVPVTFMVVGCSVKAR